MSLLATLLPVVFYLVILRLFDAFSMARPLRLASYLLWGIASALLMLAISTLWKNAHHGYGWTAIWISPLLEEIIKVLPLLVLVKTRKVVFLAETQIYGQMIGGGFALAENIIYIMAAPHMSIGTALVRGLGTSMLHMGCTSTIASLVLFTNHLPQILSYTTTVLAILPSCTIHIVYNIQRVEPTFQLLAVILFFFAIYFVLGVIDEKNTLQWLDVSIQNDISLLASLQEGKLEDTAAGRYLRSIKEKFDGMVFFDMCVYVQLYLELLMKGKSRVMLHEAGLDTPLTPEEKKENIEKFTELKTLSHCIPRLAHILLRPIIHETDKNKWAIRQFIIHNS